MKKIAPRYWRRKTQIAFTVNLYIILVDQFSGFLKNILLVSG